MCTYIQIYIFKLHPKAFTHFKAFFRPILVFWVLDCILIPFRMEILLEGFVLINLQSQDRLY